MLITVYDKHEITFMNLYKLDFTVEQYYHDFRGTLDWVLVGTRI
jgi:hypothetical protein